MKKVVLFKNLLKGSHNLIRHDTVTQAKKLCWKISPWPFFHTFQEKNLKKAFYTPLKTKKGRFLGGFKSSFKVLFLKVIPATPPRHLKQWRFANFKNVHHIFLIYHEKDPRLWYPKFWLLLWEKFHIFDNLQNKCRPPKYSYLIFKKNIILTIWKIITIKK